MLGKLMKYEVQATARWFLPAYGLLIVMGIITRISLAVRDSLAPTPDYWSEPDLALRLGDMAVMITTMFYVFIIAAVFIATTIIIIQRFYKNLMGDEGYLMFTLPVRPWENITSKLLVGLIWSVISGLVVILSLMILMINADFMELMGDMFDGISIMISDLGAQAPAFFLLLIGNIVVGLIGMILHIYGSIAIGQLAGNHRILAAFGAYIGISVVENIISSIASVFLLFNPAGMFSSMMIGYNADFNWPAQMNISMGVALLLSVVFAAALFWATNYLLTKKLNLE